MRFGGSTSVSRSVSGGRGPRTAPDVGGIHPPHRIARHHPSDRRARALASLRAQTGNADNALMRRRHGPDWRRTRGRERGPTRAAHVHHVLCGSGRGRGGLGTAAESLHCPSAAWLASTVRFALVRVAPGPRTVREVLEMSVSSILVPPAAVAHRIRGEIAVSRAGTAIRSPVPRSSSTATTRSSTTFRTCPTSARSSPCRAPPRCCRGCGPPGCSSASSRTSPGRARTDHRRRASGSQRRSGTTARPVRHLADLRPLGTGRLRVPQTDAGLDIPSRCGPGRAVERCVVIGDTEADVEAARTAGAVGILVPTARTLPAEVHRAHSHGRLAPDLATAVALAGLGRGRTADS